MEEIFELSVRIQSKDDLKSRDVIVDLIVKDLLYNSLLSFQQHQRRYIVQGDICLRRGMTVSF